MRTAVDSTVLFDVLRGDRKFGEASREALRRAYDAGALVCCDVVWAELRAHFQAEGAFGEAVELLGLRFEGTGPEASALAGRLWRERGAGRAAGQRVAAAYLVGAHAQLQAEALLTRDAAFFRKAFRSLKVVVPG